MTVPVPGTAEATGSAPLPHGPQPPHHLPAWTSRSRLRRVAPPLLLAGGLLAASVALHLRDPHEAGSWGFCPWYSMTGTFCPGCGGLRAVNDLTRGDLLSAASSNLLFVSSLPFVAIAWLRSFGLRWRGSYRPVPPWTAPVLGALSIVLIVVFWVVRNLPFATWLTP